MNSISPSIPAMTDPSIRLALASLCLALTDDGTFSDRAIASVIAYARDNGTLEGSPYIRPDELDRLTDAFVGGFPEVPYDDPEWGPPGLYQEAVVELIPDAPDFAVTQKPGYWEALAADGITPLPVISGGCDDQPSAADRADLESWLDSLESGPPVDQVEPRRNPLGLMSRALSEYLAYGCID